jgi:hypothetical protein
MNRVKQRYPACIGQNELNSLPIDKFDYGKKSTRAPVGRGGKRRLVMRAPEALPNRHSVFTLALSRHYMNDCNIFFARLSISHFRKLFDLSGSPSTVELPC